MAETWSARLGMDRRPLVQSSDAVLVEGCSDPQWKNGRDSG